MKYKVLVFLLGIIIINCDTKPSQECTDSLDASLKVKNNVEMYSKIWDTAINGRNLDDINLENFDEILLDKEKPGWQSNHLYIDSISKYIESTNKWEKVYEKNYQLAWK